MDCEWLGVGRIRCGFIIAGKTHYAHEFLHKDYDVQYTATPRLKLCYYINGIHLTSQNLYQKMMCSTCIIEGGFTPLGKRNSVRTPTVGITMPIASTSGSTTKYVIMALRLNPLYPNALLKLINFILSYNSVTYSSTTDQIVGTFEIQLHSTNGSVGSISGAPLTYVTPAGGSSVAQYAIPANPSTTLINTDGYIIRSGYINYYVSLEFNAIDYETMLTRAMVTQYDTLYLVGMAQLADDVVYASFDFIESL